jgi:hypothetical protein
VKPDYGLSVGWRDQTKSLAQTSDVFAVRQCLKKKVRDQKEHAER